jgi:predicted PurR-regulated permease PerM
MHRDILERHAVLKVLVYVITIIAVLYAGGLIWSVVIHFGGIILLFFLAWVLTFILQPLAAFLERHDLPRLAAVSIIYFALLAVAVGGVVLAIPTIHSEATLLAGELSGALAPANLSNLTNQAVQSLHRLGLSVRDATNIVGQVSSRIPTLANDLTNSAVATTTSLLGTVATLLLDVVLVMILSFYMMLDGDRLLESWIVKLPPSWLPDIRLLQRHVESIFGGFLRAQLIIAFVYGALTWLVLALVGQPNGLIFAVLAAVLMLIPFIGPFLAIVPALFLILLQSPPSSLVRDLLVVLVALIIAQQITMQIIAPRVMSAHVGLHPLLLFAALLIGARESGVWGALFAGPIAAVLVAMLDTFFERFQQSSALYPDIRPDADEPIAAWDTKMAPKGGATKTPIETSGAPVEASPRDTPVTADGARISESADPAIHGDPAQRR